MRRLLLILFILLVPVALLAQKPAPNDVAHGAEKVVHEEVHKGDGHEPGHGEPKKFAGIPTWIWKLANMVVFIGVLVYFVKGPIGEAFRAKGLQIRAAAEEAKARRLKADQLAADIQDRLTAIQKEVAAIAERAHVEGERQKRELMAAAEAEGAKILASARMEVDNRLKAARKELTEFAGDLAADRAEAILRSAMTDADQKKLFRESLTEISEARS
jgi:F-type H+-transporting ATPase subunit b